MKTPQTISPDLRSKITRLRILRSQIFRTAAAYKRLSAEINAKLAASVEVRP